MSSNTVIKLNEILKIPLDLIHNYKKYFYDKYLLKKHFNLCDMLYKSDEAILIKISKLNDYKLNKVNSDKSKILFLKKLKEYTEDPNDIKNITFKNIDDKQTKINLNEEYNIIFSNNNKWNDKNDLQKTLIKIYTSLFDSELLNRKKTSVIIDKKKKNIYNYSINEDFLNENIKLFEYRKNKQNKECLFIDDDDINSLDVI